QAVAVEGLSEHGRRRGPIARVVVRAGGDLPDHLSAQGLELAFELDLLGDAHPVLGDIGSAPALLQGDVAAPRAQRDLHRVRKGIDPCEHLTTGLTTKSDVLAHGTSFLRPDDTGALARA